MGRPAEAPLKIDSEFRPVFTVSLGLIKFHSALFRSDVQAHRIGEMKHTSHLQRRPFVAPCVINGAVKQRTRRRAHPAANQALRVCVCVCCAQLEQTRQKHCPSFLIGSFHSNILLPWTCARRQSRLTNASVYFRSLLKL